MNYSNTLWFPLIVWIWSINATLAQSPDESPQKEKPLCPMVSTPLKSGVFQLIEIIDPLGNKGVAEPGEKIKIRCTVINLTRKPLMIAENYLTPQSASMQVWGRKLNDKDFPQGKMPTIDWKNGALASETIDMPRGHMDWGHIRKWIHIAASSKLECGCSIRHRQYSRTIEIQLPKENWKTIVIEFDQWTPAMLSDFEQTTIFKSDLVIPIYRRKQDTSQPTTIPLKKR